MLYVVFLYSLNPQFGSSYILHTDASDVGIVQMLELDVSFINCKMESFHTIFWVLSLSYIQTITPYAGSSILSPYRVSCLIGWRYCRSITSRSNTKKERSTAMLMLYPGNTVVNRNVIVFHENIPPADLPCGGYSHCCKMTDQWNSFQTEIDDAIPLSVAAGDLKCLKVATRAAVREQVKLRLSEDMDIHKTTQELQNYQRQDPDLAILHDWLDEGIKPSV